MYQLQTRLVDILNLPLVDRISQLRYCVETAPLKDLQAFFKTLVHHIFGTNTNNIGWGLRTITNSSPEYYCLYSFFNPHEAFFRLLYRLQSGFVKYDINFQELPKGFRSLLESGRCNSFYTSMLSTDHFQPKVLALNAFDFYILHFVIYGTKNLHKVSPAAMAVNNENTMTVYFNLVADYLCNFLPTDPNQLVYPQIEASPMKASSQVPSLSVMNHPVKQPKYLLMSSLSHQIQNPSNQRDIKMPENVRSTNWRSETIMMLFIDCWLRYDIDESYELPSNEFIRLLRILVKQIHYFGNAADFDTSSLAVLRQQSQVLLNSRMYVFLKQIMSRWPMDSTFLNVLELWLSYIQPYRYTQNRNIHNLNQDLLDIPEKFKMFMNENLACYTQIFVKLIPRLLKMDMGLNKNAFMLYRILKVFRQPCEFLKEYERILLNSSLRATGSTILDTSMLSSSPRTPNRSSGSGRVSPVSPHSINRHPSQTAIDDSFYVPMFSDEVTSHIYELMQRVYLAKMKITHEVKVMEEQMQKNIGLWERFLQFIGQLSTLNFSFSKVMDEKKKTPVYLDFCLNILSPAFNIPIEEATREFTMSESYVEDSDNENTATSDFLNITPSYMKSQVSKISYTGDPELLPIMDHEVTWLVRFLYQVSCKLNEMFHNEMNLLWNQDGYYGRLVKLILDPPVETRIFDKSAGYSQLEVSHIGPRLSLRKFASKYFIGMFITSLILGRVLLGASSLGFMSLLFSYLFYLVFKALISS